MKTHEKYLEERELWVKQRLLIDAPRADLNQSLPGPVIPTLTDNDTLLGPSPYIGGLAIYFSPWIDLCSDDPYISSISRQVLNLEAAYANFCGARTIVVPGPRKDSSRGIAQYARAIREALQVANRANLIIHMPMYREPGLEEKSKTLTDIFGHNDGAEAAAEKAKEIDLFGAWDSWNTIRSVCNYSMRLFVGRFGVVPLWGEEEPRCVRLLTDTQPFGSHVVSPRRPSKNGGLPSPFIT